MMRKMGRKERKETKRSIAAVLAGAALVAGCHSELYVESTVQEHSQKHDYKKSGGTERLMPKPGCKYVDAEVSSCTAGIGKQVEAQGIAFEVIYKGENGKAPQFSVQASADGKLLVDAEVNGTKQFEHNGWLFELSSEMYGYSHSSESYSSSENGGHSSSSEKIEASVILIVKKQAPVSECGPYESIEEKKVDERSAIEINGIQIMNSEVTPADGGDQARLQIDVTGNYLLPEMREGSEYKFSEAGKDYLLFAAEVVADTATNDGVPKQKQGWIILKIFEKPDCE